MATDAYKLLYQGQLAATVGTLITVGDGLAHIIKHITVVNNDSAPRTFQFFRQGTAAANAVTPVMTIPAGGFAEWDGTQAMAATETFRGIASVATMLTATVSGDEITL